MQEFLNWLVIFVRAGALMTVFPIFSAQHMPARLRMALAAALAYFASLGVGDFSFPTDSMLPMIGILGMEIMVGLLMGFVAKMLFYAVDIVGAICSAEIGLAMAQISNPISGGQKPVLTTTLYYLAALLWLGFNFHHELMVAFVRSYDYLPIGGASLNEPLAMGLIARTNGLFRIGLQMAAPIMAVIFIVTLIFAVFSRAVPQMNVFIMSFAAKLLVGLVVFGMTVTLMARHIVNYASDLQEDVLRVVLSLGS